MGGRFPMEEKIYRVILHGVGNNTELEKTRFCEEVSSHYGIPLALMKKISDRSPIVIKKNLSFKKAETLAIALQSCGASVSVERRRLSPPIFLEFVTQEVICLGLESSNLRRSSGGSWEVIGRVKNLSNQAFEDVWALIQAFDEEGDLLTYEEIPIPINPLCPNESSPFKALFEKDLPIKRISITLKTASGNPIPVLDQRNKKEWVEIKIAEKKKEGLPDLTIEAPEEAFTSLEPQNLSIAIENETVGQGEGERRDFIETPFLEFEDILMESEDETELSPERGEPSIELEREAFSKSPEPLLLETVSEEEELHLDLSEEEPLRGSSQIEPSSFPSLGKPEEKASPVGMKIDELPAFSSWLNDFRRTIEVLEQTHIDPFFLWFQTLQKEGYLEDPHASLLAILIYARFNQTSSDSALENTQKVFHHTLNKEVNMEDLPSLKGDLFFPPEVWRELYIRAIPKLKEVSHRILEKHDWNLSDLDRLIRIIPHMTARNSRWAIRTIHYWIPGLVPDISEMPVDIQEELYRVASRLGVVNPLFDYYQGKHSMGDIKIQAFAKAAFPEDPGKIEGPMNRIGSKGKTGSCLPIQPLCPQCPFEGFCGKFFLDFDPSEKGMVFRPL